MKKQQLLSVLVVLVLWLTTSISANGQNFAWAKTFETTGQVIPRTIATDANGNVLVGGNHYGDTDFDPGPGTDTLQSAINTGFLCKLDAAGNLLWLHDIRGAYSVRDVVITPSGNCIAVGNFNTPIDFEPGTGNHTYTTTGGYDFFVFICDANGNILRTETFGSTDDDRAIAVAVDVSGNIYIGGKFGDVVDFDPGAGTTSLTATTATDAFVLKLDGMGNFDWVRALSGVPISPTSGFTDLTSIAVSPLGDVYFAGRYSGMTSLHIQSETGTTPLNIGNSYEQYIIRIDSAGTFGWLNHINSTITYTDQHLATDNSGAVYYAAYFTGTVDLDPSANTYNFTAGSGASDVCVGKCDRNGNFQWGAATETSGGFSEADLGGFAVTQDGRAYITGYMHGDVDFDPAATGFVLTTTNYSKYLWALDVNGNLDYALGTGWNSSGSMTPYDIAVRSGGPIYTSGKYQNSIDFDPTSGDFTLTANAQDGWVQKLVFCSPSQATDTQSACGPFTWINGVTYTSNNNTAVDTLQSVGGCDSIVTLDLTINTVNASVTSTGPVTLMADASGATYQWVDCNDNYTLINGETSQSFTATSNGDYAVIVTEGNCSDTSACQNITGIGVGEFSLNAQVSIYPNPSNGQFTVNVSKLSQGTTIRVLDMVGKEVYFTNVLNQNTIIDLNAQASGLYLLHINTPQGNAVKQLILR